MKIKPCPFCGKMPKITTRLLRYKRATKETVDIPNPITTAFIDVIVNCQTCGYFKSFRNRVFINCSETEWCANDRVRRNTKKVMVEGILDEIWNRRAEGENPN